MNYGIPYMGSKSVIAKKVISYFPPAHNFYDLFGGGFSVTHAMILHRSKDFKEFHFNEIRPGVTKLIKDAIDGKYSYDKFKPEWISKDRFLKEKDYNAYIKLIWSFGNNGKDYLFGDKIEGYKESLHNAIIFNQFDETAKKTLGIDSFKDGYDIKSKRLFLRGRFEQLQQLLQLERLQQLERLEQLQQLKQLYFYNESYEKINIKNDSVVYCDIPYYGTKEYDKSDKEFSHRNFFDWAASQDFPIFISEYNVNDKRFKCLANIKKRVLLDSAKSDSVKIEKIYVNKCGYEKLMSKSR